MHNFDRTNLEATYGESYPGEFEAGGYQNEYHNEYAGEYGYEFEGGFGSSYSGESPFTEAEEMELAAELLAVGSEAELDHFIKGLMGRASQAAGAAPNGAMPPATGKKLGSIIKGVAKRALPMLGKMAGNMFVPGLGGMIGGKIGSVAGNMLGLELEGLSQEDQEFEAAKQLVRFAGAAAGNVAQTAASVPPQEAVQKAAVSAAQQYAPGILRAAHGLSAGVNGQGCQHAPKGTWVRRGNAIILYGA
jgi:hypothetical protein